MDWLIRQETEPSGSPMEVVTDDRGVTYHLDVHNYGTVIIRTVETEEGWGVLGARLVEPWMSF